MPRPSYNQLYFFHVVATERSLRGAAQSLDLSQSTLSEHIRKLEAALDTPLFDRRGRQLRLNDAGRVVYEHTQSMFRIGERLLERFGGRDDGQRVLVKVGVTATVSRRTESTRFQPLLRRSDILVQIRHADHAHLMEELAANELDAVLSDVRPSSEPHHGLGVRELESSVLVAVAAPSFQRRIEEETRFPESLDRLPHIAYPKHSRLGWDVDGWMGEHSVSPAVVAEVDDVAMMLLAAQEGTGFAVVPQVEARAAVERGVLTVLGVLEGTRAAVYAIYPEHSPSEIVLELIGSLDRA